MSENNLATVPDQGKRRAAARRARIERRQQRSVGDQAGGENQQQSPKQAANLPAQRNESEQALDVLRPETFVLPPKARIERRSSRFGYIMRLTFLAFVLAPTIITALFYVFVASDQYATESSFSVRGAEASSSGIDIGSFAGIGGMGIAADDEAADSFIVQEYIRSREMVESLITEANFIEIYSRPSADGYYRLDPDTSIEDMTAYWQMMCDVDFDTDTGIITMTVRAFRPQDAETITRKVLEKAEALVNELSRRSRDDRVAAAKREVDIAEQRYANSRTALAANRATEKEIDPTATAQTRAELVGGLESQLAEKEAELSALRATMSDNAPRVQVVRNEIVALQRQIAVERLSVAVAEQGDTQPVLTDRLSQYEELLAEREFSERAYVSALSTLEAARINALKQQRYLAVFVRGSAPEKSTFPEGLRWTLIVFGVLLAIWTVCSLVAAAVRDQLE